MKTTTKEMDYQQGYFDAIDDVEEAMKLATRVMMGPDGVQMFNDPELFTTELKRLRANRPKLEKSLEV